MRQSHSSPGPVLIPIFILALSPAFAAESPLSGVVRDSVTGAPIPGALVRRYHAAGQDTADGQGRYQIGKPATGLGHRSPPRFTALVPAWGGRDALGRQGAGPGPAFDRIPARAALAKGAATVDSLVFFAPGYVQRTLPITIASGEMPPARLTPLPVRDSGATFQSGKIWKDTDGHPIQAHGGGLLLDGGVYYWYGEDKAGITTAGPLNSGDAARVDVVGISCYSSQDLIHWKYEGLALPAERKDTASELYVDRILERPKVIKCEQTGKYVMWIHTDRWDYRTAHAGVAVADKPTGPFRFLGSYAPGDWMSWDIGLLRDDDGKAYLYNEHGTFPLSADYTQILSLSGPGWEGREAPVPLKYGGKYYRVTSGKTWWEPNSAAWAVGDGPMTNFTEMGNPCVGPGSGDDIPYSTFRSQGTYALPVPGRPGCFIFIADRWNSKDLGNSTYVWLPMTIKNGKLAIYWRERWDFSVFDSL